MNRHPFANNDGDCAFQCAKNYYWLHFNCTLHGVAFNRCHQMKIARLLIEKHLLNVSSFAPILSSTDFSDLQQSIHDFPTSKDKVDTLLKIIKKISNGHEKFIVETCKEQCQLAPPFCTTWDISVEKWFAEEALQDVSNNSISLVHDMSVHVMYNVKYNVLVYQEVLMISLDNFVGQLGGLIGLYIGWSFVSVAAIFLKMLPAFLRSGEFKSRLMNIANSQQTNRACEKRNEQSTQT